MVWIAGLGWAILGNHELSLVNLTWRSCLGYILHQHIPRHRLCTGGGSADDLGVDRVWTGVVQFVATDI